MVVITDLYRVRLVDGSNPCSGRVEVMPDLTWGTVCENDFDWKDAEVICRQENCGIPKAVLGEAYFGEGQGPVWSEKIQCQGNETHLTFCQISTRQHQNCTHKNDVSIVCSGYTGFRLINGSDSCSGRVELQYDGEWGTVCDQYWDMRDASVLCRQLGCGLAVAVPGQAWFGHREGSVWKDHFLCDGSEAHLSLCATSTLGGALCSHRNDAGLVCSGYTAFRLANGSDPCSGRVELEYNGKWGTVCDQYWDLRDASVLCRQLGCGVAVAAPGQAWFGEREGSVWKDHFLCDGSEAHLSLCATSALGGVLCSHRDDAGLVCSGPVLSAQDVRLTGGRSHCEGRVEVQYNRTCCILMGSWDNKEASVVCRQLGCGSVVQIYNSSLVVCLTGIQCLGDESDLVNCSSPQTVSCSPGQEVALLCSTQRSLRLVGGGDDCAGRLEVYHSGSWGTICDDSWDLADSQVVCRQLQCGTALSAPVPASFSQGTGPIWLDEVGCMGNESSLWECPSAGWGQHDCRHKEDVRILCSEHKQLRLSAGCSGQAEVYYNGTWGSVCQNGMTNITAGVICKQLGCGDKGTVRETNSRLSPDPKWLDFVSCRKHDSTLWQCPSSPWGQNECEDREVAEITCSGKKISCFSLLHPIRSLGFLHCSGFSLSEALRLAGGTNCSGRVELRYEGSWGTVCDDSWDLQDAQVVCRQLGCGDAVSAAIEASFGPGSGAIWLDEVNCRGSELLLWDCCHSGLNQSDCQHKEDAGVTCTGKIGGMEDFQYITNRDSYLCRSFVFCHVISFIS
ncbi:C163A protein, partial [Atractosteus spatula]|nr:C163A protein [Atractosteus spatula]